MLTTFFRMMHSPTGRTARVFGGFWLVIYGADQTPGYAFTLAVIGTAIAVTGIADLCAMELIVNAIRDNRRGPRERAA